MSMGDGIQIKTLLQHAKSVLFGFFRRRFHLRGHGALMTTTTENVLETSRMLQTRRRRRRNIEKGSTQHTRVVVFRVYRSRNLYDTHTQRSTGTVHTHTHTPDTQTHNPTTRLHDADPGHGFLGNAFSVSFKWQMCRIDISFRRGHTHTLH